MDPKCTFATSVFDDSGSPCAILFPRFSHGSAGPFPGVRLAPRQRVMWPPTPRENLLWRRFLSLLGQPLDAQVYAAEDDVGDDLLIAEILLRAAPFEKLGALRGSGARCCTTDGVQAALDGHDSFRHVHSPSLIASANPLIVGHGDCRLLLFGRVITAVWNAK